MRDSMNTGAKKRNKVLPRYDLIPPSSLRRLALVYTEGAEHYGAYNWCEGYPYSDILNHALEHLNRYLQGDHSEDQLAKVAWAMFTLMFFDETGRGELNDIRWVGRQMSGKEADEIDAMIEQCLAETQTASA